MAKKSLVEGPNVNPFQFLGGLKMREWIQINLENSEKYREYMEVFEESITFVLTLQRKEL
jgi:hypothetical protein